MEENLLCYLFVLLCVIFFTYLSLHHLIPKHKASSANEKLHLPPGRTGWPLLGETLDYYSNFKNGVLDKFAAERMTKYSSKVFRTSLIGQPVAVLCGAEGNKFLFSNERKLVRAWSPATLDKIFPQSGSHNSSREDFLQVRKLLHLFLKGDGLRQYVGAMDEMMKQSIERDWDRNREELRVGAAVKKYTFPLACRVILGIEDPEMVERLAKPAEDITDGAVSLPVNLPGTALRRAVKSSELMRGEIEEIIRQKKRDKLEKKEWPLPNKKQDVLSHLLMMPFDVDNGGQHKHKHNLIATMSEANMASHVAGLLHASYETLDSALIFTIKYLAEFPHVYNEVLKEQMEIANSKAEKEELLLNWDDARKMKHSWNVAREVLRLMPPAPGAFRESITDFTYAGYLIPKGWKLHSIAQITHKNPQYFPNPERFNPARFEGNGPPPFTYVPFGAGPRMCPGNEYARLVILVFMHNVVTKFRWERLLPNEKVVSDPLPMPTQGLPIRLHPHNP